MISHIIMYFVIAYLGICAVAMAFFLYEEPSRFATGLRIARTTYANGEVEYVIEQRVPFIFLWLTCYRQTGVQYYEAISFRTVADACEYINSVKTAHDKLRGWTIKHKDNL